MTLQTELKDLSITHPTTVLVKHILEIIDESIASNEAHIREVDQARRAGKTWKTIEDELGTNQWRYHGAMSARDALRRVRSSASVGPLRRDVEEFGHTRATSVSRSSASPARKNSANSTSTIAAPADGTSQMRCQSWPPLPMR